jgi:protein-disulfide isomerase
MCSIEVVPLAKIGRISLLIPVFLVLLGAGCKAQTTGAASGLPPDVVHRIQTEIRSRYNVPPQIDIALSAPKPADMPGYDTIVVTFSGGTHTSTHDFLLSKDRKTLAHLEKMDISQDLMSKIDVKGRPVRGNGNAKVTIVNYDDFECPFCSRMHATLFPDILKSYGDRIKIIYKDYPLVEIHPWAMHAAVDANCLADQNTDAYWEFADYVHANQREITPKRQGETQPNWTEAFAKLDALAKERATRHNLDQQKFDACVKKQDDSAVRASMAEGDKLGVDSTPTLFVNGERMSGAVPEDQMRAILNRALVAAGEQAPTAAAKN